MRESVIGIHPDEILRFTGNSEQEVLSKGWSSTNVAYSNGKGSFNGTSSFISTNKLTFSKSFIVRAKLAPDSFSNKVYVGGDSNSRIRFESSTQIRIVSESDSAVFNFSEMTAGETYEIIITRDDSNNVELFLNGNSEDTGTLVGDFVFSQIGRRGSTGYYDGTIDFVEVLDCSCNESDAKAWYEGRMFSELPKSVNGSDGVVGEWNLARNWFNTAGDAIVDASGNGNNASLVNMDTSNLTTDAFGRAGKALSLNGSDEYLSLGSTTVFDGMSEISVFGIVDFDVDGDQYKSLIHGSTSYFCSFIDTVGNTMRIYVNSASNDSASAPFKLSGPVFFVINYDGATVNYYANGKLIDSNSFSQGAINASGGQVYNLFANNNGAGAHGKGKGQRIGFTNYIIGPAQIKAMWAQLQNAGFGK